MFRIFFILFLFIVGCKPANEHKKFVLHDLEREAIKENNVRKIYLYSSDYLDLKFSGRKYSSKKEGDSIAIYLFDSSGFMTYKSFFKVFDTPLFGLGYNDEGFIDSIYFHSDYQLNYKAKIVQEKNKVFQFWCNNENVVYDTTVFEFENMQIKSEYGVLNDNMVGYFNGYEGRKENEYFKEYFYSPDGQIIKTSKTVLKNTVKDIIEPPMYGICCRSRSHIKEYQIYNDRVKILKESFEGIQEQFNYQRTTFFNQFGLPDSTYIIYNPVRSIDSLIVCKQPDTIKFYFKIVL
jgi:hypothetical protein